MNTNVPVLSSVLIHLKDVLSHLDILKQNFEQLGSVVGGALINAFKPLVQALNSVMGKLIAFAETVSNAL